MKELYAAVRHVMAASDARGTTRSVLLGLSIHMDVTTFESRPGHDRLMDYAGASRSTVQRSLAKLEESLCEIVQVAPGSGACAARYRIIAGADTWSPMGDHLTRWSGGQGSGQKGLVSASPMGDHPTGTREQTSFNGSCSGGADPEPIAPVLFDEIRRRLAVDVGSGFIAHTMVEPLEQLGRAGGVLRVVAPDYCELELSRRYGRRLTAIATEVLGEPVDVEIVFERQLHGGRR